jgi:hypothetical protein
MIARSDKITDIPDSNYKERLIENIIEIVCSDCPDECYCHFDAINYKQLNKCLMTEGEEIKMPAKKLRTMKLEFENVIVKYKRRIRFVDYINVADKNDLPDEYTKEGPCCFEMRVGNSKYLFVESDKDDRIPTSNNISKAFDKGDILTIEEKEWLVRTMKAAGHRLFKLNEEKKKELKDWFGRKETIKI